MATDSDADVSPPAPAGPSEVAVLGGGCFWCLEAVFNRLRGVAEVESGYAGGAGANPTYEEVCGGDTGHAEVVRVRFDPSQLLFRDLLRVFFTIHDPTTLNRQGNDRGTQYRSVIFYEGEEQKAAAESVMAELKSQGVWQNPLVTELAPLPAFYAAEKYHHRYFERNGQQPYCAAVISPKVAKFRKAFSDRVKVA